MPTKSKQFPAAEPKDPQLPNFKPDALLSLTKKIESNLKKPVNGIVSKTRPAKPNPKRREKKENNQDSLAEHSKPVPKAESKSNSKTPLVEQIPVTAPKTGQGKKRLHDGQVKNSSHANSVNNIKLGKGRQRNTKDEGLNAGEDIEAVGGTKDDMDLVAGAPSESEMEDDGNELTKDSGGNLRKDLHQLIQKLVTSKRDLEGPVETSALDDEVAVPDQGRKPKADVLHPQRRPKDVRSTPEAAKPLGKGQKTLVFQPQSEWHAAVDSKPSLSAQELVVLPLDLSDRVYTFAKSLLENENKHYAAHHSSASSAHQFYSIIMSTGTLSDKISALTLSVQESPIHNMKALESLVGLARKRSRGQAVEVLGALKDLFGPGNLLPSDRKLRTFASQPALSAAFDPLNLQWTSKNPLPSQLKEVHLISWAYEDWLKSIFFEVLRIIETWLNDEVVFARGKAVDYVCSLLKEKPEQEKNLLRILVNKLGDTDKKIASKTSFNILQLENTHPLMKTTIIEEIESGILFQSGQSLHAKYYATITLNQTVLSGNEDRVARKLLDIYFDLFVKLLQKPKMAKPAATGANDITINKKGEVQGGGGPAGKKAQKNLAEKEKATTGDEDLREKMLSAVLTGINRAMPFTNTSDDSFEKHLDTLFRVTHSSNFNTSIQALMLIQQLNSSHQGSVDRFYRTLYESLLDPRLLTSSKQALYLNLVFKALRSDLNIKRVKAFAKRLLQVVALHQPSFTCGTLYLLRELEGVFANLEAFIDQPEQDDSDDEEIFNDVQEDDVNNPDLQDGSYQAADSAPPNKGQKSQRYDGRKRDPEYSNADTSTLWEIIPFLQHYHPSVSLFANRLITHEPMPPKPDLSLNTLIHFLDRFVYRNPKATTAPRGASIMQPMVGGDSSALLISAHSNKSNSKQPVNSEAFWKQESGKVNADEVFFHKYFSTLGRGREKAKNKKSDKKKGGEDSEDEEEEEEIWKALVESRPELDGASDGGYSDDDGGSGIEDLEEEGDSELDDQEEQDDMNGVENDDGGLHIDEDDEALLDTDAEVPSDLEEAFQKDLQSSNRKESQSLPEQGENRGKKRRRLKNLPTFASAEDYAKMLVGDDD